MLRSAKDRAQPAPRSWVTVCALLALVVAMPASAENRVRLVGPGAEAQPPRIDVLQQSAQGLQAEVTLSELTVTEVPANGTVYQEVSIPGGSLSGATGEPMLPVFGRLVSIPDRAGVEITSTVLEEEEFTGINLMPAQGIEGSPFVIDLASYARSGYGAAPLVATSEPALARGLRVAPITFAPVRYDAAARKLWVARRMQIDVRFAGVNLVNERRGPARPITESFDRLYRNLVINYEAPRPEDVVRGTWLLISANNSSVVSKLQPLIEWRTRQGYRVYATTTQETGTSESAIKAFIQNAYDTWEAPPEFIVLAGDGQGNYSIPTGHETFSGYYGEGDHGYTQLEGGDLLGDAHIGRLSFSNLDELDVIVSKVVKYESTPYIADPSWFTAACLVGDPYDSGYSTVQCQQWIKTGLRQHNYTRIDTVFTSPFVSGMRNALNRGDTIFCYRGIYGVSGWTNSNTYALTNTNKLFFAVVITCGTGSFEGGTSYSEAFLRTGSVSEPRAGIGAVCTATTGTHTRFNNCYTMGAYQGLLWEDMWEMGAAHTRGKLELYVTYNATQPTQAGRYTWWNNLMGDPACKVWSAFPAPLSVTYPASVSVGASAVTIHVEKDGGGPSEGAQVCLWKGSETHSVGWTNAQGDCELMVDLPTAGTMKLTVTNRNCQPLLADINVATMPYFVSLLSSTVDDDGSGDSQGNGDGVPNPGETVEWTVRLKNFGTNQVDGVSARLTCPDPYVTILQDMANFGSMPAGSDAAGDAAYRFAISSACPHDHVIRLGLDIESGSWDWHAAQELSVAAADLHATDLIWFNNMNGVLDRGEVSEASIRLENRGPYAAFEPTARLISLSPWVYVLDGEAAYPFIPAGGSGVNSDDRYRLSAAPNAVDGQMAVLQLVTSFNSGMTDTTYATISIGTREQTDPIGPDGYGYYAFDDTDTGYGQAPTYNWVELDPAFGGNGTEVDLGDYYDYQDKSRSMDLPFPFQYYGEVFTRVTICSNGWIALGDTYLTDYRNFSIPGVGSPPNLIAVFWDDLSEDSNAHVYQRYDAAGHRWIVQWSRLHNEYNTSYRENVEVILFDPAYHPTTTGDGMILMQYEDVNNIDPTDHYATVGIQNAMHTDGLLYTFFNRYPDGAATLADGRAILFTPSPIGFSGGPDPVPAGSVFDLSAAAPNPFSGSAQIRFSLQKAGPAELTIHDVAGRVIRRLVKGQQQGGAHSVIWDGKDDHGRPASAGLYFYRLSSEEGERSLRMIKID